MRRLLSILSVIFLLSSCGTFQVNGNARIRFESIGNITRHCQNFAGRKVTVKAKYLGWNCPPECRHPGLTRSDSCIADQTGCIYLYGTGGLDPISDREKFFVFRGTVKKSPHQTTCYIEVDKVDEVK